MTTTQAPVPLAPEEEISRRLHLGRWLTGASVSGSVAVAAVAAAARVPEPAPVPEPVPAPGERYNNTIQWWFHDTGLSAAATDTPAPATHADRMFMPSFCTIRPAAVKEAITLTAEQKKFASELMTYVMFHHQLSPTKSFSIGPGVSVSVFGAIAWILLLFSSVFDDKTLILQHLYREFKHRLAASARAQAAVRDKPEWSLEEGLMYHATLLIELMKGSMADLKFKPQPLKVLRAEFTLGRCPPDLIQQRDDAYNIYAVIANDMPIERRRWEYSDPILNVMSHFYTSRWLADAKERGYYKGFMCARYMIMVKGAFKLLNADVASTYADAVVLSPEPAPEITAMPEYKIAHFISKIIVANRMAEQATAARV